MLIDEAGGVVNLIMDNEQQVLLVRVSRDLGIGVLLRHLDCVALHGEAA